MMRLSPPESDFSATIDECIKGITGNKAFKAKMVTARPDLITAGIDYIAAGDVGELHTIDPVDTNTTKDPVVVGTLIKSELVNLYDYYFRNEDKEARVIYDKLLNSAHEKCPFCGGIGTPRNLDHFLPKAHFPQYSVFPQNLVPSCRDCNMDGKAEAFATAPGDQLIQPYVDHDRFFVNQWIFAEYTTTSPNIPGTISYFVDAPKYWIQTYKDRVKKHFDDFNLAKRYSVKAAELLGTTLGQVSSMQNRGIGNDVIRDILLKPGIDNAPFVNHWQKGMFQALHKHFQ
jgi:hypothetical protein